MKAGWLVLALLAAAGPAAAQGDCPHASEVRQATLLGLWRADLAGSGHAGTILLEPHPHYKESFRGTINRGGQRSQLAGDVEDGEFTMEESADGVRIAATWLGEIVEGSCGKEIRGTWKAEGSSNGTDFVLRKQ